MASPTLTDDIRQAIEENQWLVRPLLHDLVERMPTSVAARFLLAQSYVRSLESETALEHFRIAHQLDPQNVALRHQMGFCALAMADYETAFSIHLSINADKPNEHSQFVMALTAHRLGRVEESANLYGKLLAKLKRDHAELPHALRGFSFALRDLGLHLISDHPMAELRMAFNREPRTVGVLTERDNSIDHPAWTPLAHKASLAKALRKVAHQPWCPRHPTTFIMPEDREALQVYSVAHPEAVYIAKPQRGTGGQNMEISRDAQALSLKPDVVVQRYVDRPYLVDGRKAHIRMHGLITSFAPLRAYFHNEGIVRFAPETYDTSDIGLADVHAHITNTALHKGHAKLVLSEQEDEENVGAIWSLAAYLARIAADGVDIARVRQDLLALARGFLKVIENEGIIAAHHKHPRRSFPPKLFGFDILLDAEAKPWLIEIQRKPATAGTPMMNKILGRMIADIFKMTSTFVVDDSLPAERIALLVKDRQALLEREIEQEDIFRGGFQLM